MKSLKRSIEKNLPEARAILSGQMPPFVFQFGNSGSLNEVPVFVFHQVTPENFEKQLKYLRENGYYALNAEELYKYTSESIKKDRVVALTFDDATWSFWSCAFPLLKKYDFKAILFAIPGIVPDDPASYFNLEDMWGGKCSLDELNNRAFLEPLCTWDELIIMHESGKVDIQSHSLNHTRIFVSPKLVDFFSPDFDTDIFGNVNVPVTSLDNQDYPERKLQLGAPVFESASRFTCLPRFKESTQLVDTFTSYVREHGERDFFIRHGWRGKLYQIFKKWPVEKLGYYETTEEMKSAVLRELTESKKILEKRLSGKKVNNFCYPWFESSDMADHFVVEAGYQTAHLGLNMRFQSKKSDGPLMRIRRISEEYLLRLPGDGRSFLSSIWMSRLRKRLA